MSQNPLCSSSASSSMIFSPGLSGYNLLIFFMIRIILYLWIRKRKKQQPRFI
ncbi:MAG: hypothetical protein JW774_04470 [Candidatus Aureabacteria bacterium]|nr:hypothetical protein [Candidatus Auribacterota bacterium]